MKVSITYLFKTKFKMETKLLLVTTTETNSTIGSIIGAIIAVDIPGYLTHLLI